MKIKIDHATICGRDLHTMQLAFKSAGLAPDYGGPHANGITHMALLGLEDGSYLELIAPYNPGPLESSPWAKLMLDDAVAGAWAAGTADIHGEVARLNDVGIQTTGPNPGSRRRPDGTMLKWETASAGPGTMGAVLPFMIQDHTPRDLRVQPSASLTGSGITGMAAVVIGVKNIEVAAALFRQAYGWDAPYSEDHAGFSGKMKLAYFPGTPVILASPLQENSWLGERLGKFGEIPAAFFFKAPDLAKAARRFSLSRPMQWFGRELAWFDMVQWPALRLGVIQD